MIMKKIFKIGQIGIGLTGAALTCANGIFRRHRVENVVYGADAAVHSKNRIAAVSVFPADGLGGGHEAYRAGDLKGQQ